MFLIGETRNTKSLKMQCKELGALLPELYLHGLAEGDFELAMRGLLGEGAPLSESSIRLLRAGDGRRSSRNGASVAWRAVRSSTYRRTGST